MMMLLKKPSTAQNHKLHKSTILEPMRILRRGKRHAGQIVKIYKRTKFQTHGPNTGLVNEGLKLGL